MSLSPDRKGRITASRVGAILGLSPFAKPADAIRDMVRDYHGADREFVGNVATDWGNEHEAEAVVDAEFELGYTFNHTGHNQRFMIHPEHDWLGATPDGISEDGLCLLEVKCPYGMRNGGAFKSLSVQPHYFAQLQVAMFCAGAECAQFGQWSPVGWSMEYVEFDRDWMSEHLPALKAFFDLYQSEIDNPAHLEPLRGTLSGEIASELLAEYDSACRLSALADERKKSALAALVEMSGGADVEIYGRKLTKVVREGSVSYANAIKDLAPDADLSAYKGKPSAYWRLT